MQDQIYINFISYLYYHGQSLRNSVFFISENMFNKTCNGAAMYTGSLATLEGGMLFLQFPSFKP